MLDSKIGFDIGWDCFARSVPVTRSRFSPEEFDLLIIGFKAASAKKIKVSRSDRYESKYMLLRINAWRRGRAFDPAVTPQFIKDIDVDICPITGMTLTHSSNSESDWSVDRINNDAAYSPGNLVIVSSLANIGKDRYSYDDIRRFALDPDAILPAGSNGMRALTKIEWMRWLSICSLVIVVPKEQIIEGGTGLGFDVVPCVTTIPRRLPLNGSVCLQKAIQTYISNAYPDAFKRVLAALPKSKRRSLRDVMELARKVSDQMQTFSEIWFHQKLFRVFFDFYNSLDVESEEVITKALLFRSSYPLESIISIDNWAIDRRGFQAVKQKTKPAKKPVQIEQNFEAAALCETV